MSRETWSDGITHNKPHARPENLDPRHNGPFLDDIREDQERAMRQARVTKPKKRTSKKDKK